MKLHRFAIALLFTFIAHIAIAQRTFNPPKNYAFDTPDDYHKYDKDIIKCVNYLESVPINEPQVKPAGNFMMEWLSGCPYINVSQNVQISSFLADSPELNLYFMAGWARYALQHPGDTPDKTACNIAAIKTVLRVYKENKSYNRDPNIDEVAKVEHDGKLKDWVEQRLD